MANNGQMELTLKPVTPRALRVYKEKGMLTNNNQEFVGVLTEIYLNETELAEIWQVTFKEAFPKDYENLNLEQVNRGFRNFLLKALGV